MMPLHSTISRTNIAARLFVRNRLTKFVSPYSTAAAGGSLPGSTTPAAATTSASTSSAPASSASAAATAGSATSATSRRGLSTQGSTALLRLQNALEEYRLREYQREVPSRFKKDIVRAAVASNIQTASKPSNCIRDATAIPKHNPSTRTHPTTQHQHRHHYQEKDAANDVSWGHQQQQPFVALEGLYHVLTNIGGDKTVSKMDLQTLFNEIGIVHSANNNNNNSSSNIGYGDGQQQYQYMVPARELIQML